MKIGLGVRRKDLSRIIIKDLDKITNPESSVNSVEDARVILNDCLRDLHTIYSNMGKQDADSNSVLIYGYVGSWIEFLEDIVNSKNINVMKNKLHYFFVGYINAQMQDVGKNNIHEQTEVHGCKVCGHDEEACDFDEVVRRAKELIGFKKRASAALLQMDLKISYSTSEKVLEILEADGIVGPTDGANPRKVY